MAFVKCLHHACALAPNEVLGFHTMALLIVEHPQSFPLIQTVTRVIQRRVCQIGSQMLEQPSNAFPKDALVPTGSPIIPDPSDARPLKIWNFYLPWYILKMIFKGL